MSIASEITSIGENLKKDYQSIANLGADLTNVDKNIENIAELLDGVYNRLPKTEFEEGESVTLENTLKGKLDFDDGKVGYGQSSQETTQGYNLLPLNPTTLRTHNTQGNWVNDYTYTQTGITYTIDYSTGKIKISGTSTAVAVLAIPITLTQGNTYRISGCPSNGGANSYRAYMMDTQSFSQSVNDDGSGAVLQSASYTSYEYRCRIANGYTANNIVFEPMVIDGSTAKTFEKYTGGQASPNPSYPQTINSVTGNQDVVVSGKNECDGINQDYYINSVGTQAGKITGNSGLAIPIKANTTYTISTTTSQERYRVGFVSNLPADNEWVTTYSGQNKDNTSNSITITNTNYQYLIVNATDLTKIQIEQGSTATPYEPYITPTSYQLSLGDKKLYDECYIVGSPDNWKFVEKYGKVNANDFSFGIGSITISGQTYSQFSTPSNTPTILKGGLNTSDKVKCNKFLAGNNVIDTFYINSGRRIVVVAPILNGNYVTDIDTFNTIKSDMYIVGELNTPIETPITDETLISQLNAWYNAHSNNGTSIITSNGNLPMIIKVRALKGE